jgi:hypothetical protein
MTSTDGSTTPTTPHSYGSVNDLTPPRPLPSLPKPDKRRSSASRRRSSSSLTPLPSSFSYLSATTTGRTSTARLIRSRNRLLAEYASSDDEDEEDSDDIELGVHPGKPPTTTDTTTTTTDVRKKSERENHKWDDEMLQTVMANVGHCASGVVYLQLWVLNEQRNRLVQPSAGAWLDPIFHDCPYRNHGNKKRSSEV